MEKLKKLLFSFLIIFAGGFTLTSVVRAATGIKESVEDFTTDVYIIGSTKFDNHTTVTAPRAAQAGSDEMLLQIINGNFEFQRNKIKTYRYSEIEDLWFEIPKEGGEPRELTEAETEQIEDNLNIFFVNDNEKMIEFEYSGEVNEDTIEASESLSGAEVRYEKGKFYIPVTTIELSFETTSGEQIDITTNYDEEEDKIGFGEFYIPITVTILDENGEIIPDFYVQTTKDGKIGSVDYLMSYEGVQGYGVYYLDEEGMPIDFDTFIVTEPISIKQAWNPRGDIYTDSYYHETSLEIVHYGSLYKNGNETYIKAKLVAPLNYDTTNSKVNGQTVEWIEGIIALDLPVINNAASITVEWEEGIEVTFNIIISEEASYVYEVTLYDDKNEKIETIDSIEEGFAVDIPEYVFEKENMVFDGWTTNTETNKKYDFDTPITEDLNLYPRFVTLKEFVENSSAENPAILKSNITITEKTLIDKDADMVLDLGGYEITAAVDVIRLKGNNTSLVVKNGTITTTADGAAPLKIGTSQENTSNVVKRQITVMEDVTLNSVYYGIAVFGKSQLDFYGKLNITKDGYAISGNGMPNNEGTIINIYEGAEISAPNGSALYLPQLGETNIMGGTLTGYSVVGIKAGALNISGGTLTSTGDYVAPKPKNDGMDMTGDVIIAEENASYADHIQVNVTGGTLVANGEGSALIREYNPSLGTENERYVTVTGNYATKNKVDDITYVYTESTDGDFVYDGTYYKKEDLQTYLEMSSDTTPVVLTKDITLTERMIIDKDADMVLDLGGKTITSAVDVIRLKGNNASLVVKNGTITTTADGAAPLKIGTSQENTSNVVKRQITVMEDVTLNSVYYGIAVFGKSQLDFYGKLNITKDGYAISGNGMPNNEGTIINIYEGAEISAPNGSALYLPQLGETNIMGGTLTGYSVVGIKAGALNISGGTLTSTGDYVAPKPKNDGMDMTGDVIIAEENASYADHIQVNVTGGTLVANGEGSALIREYNPSLGTENERYVTVTGKYATKNTVDEITYTFTETTN